MDTLLPLEAYESDPEFLSLTPEDKDKFYSNYYTKAQESAQSEDDYNNLLKYRADRTKSALQSAYLNEYPDDTEIDPAKARASQTIAPLFDRLQNDYSELEWNQTQKPQKYSADDMEDSTRSLVYKPFIFGGKRGYSVKYPDGAMESIKDISDESQLTEYFRKNRLDKFNGSREGFFDKLNPVADGEFDMIYDKIKNTDAGIKGGFNAIRNRYAKMTQGFDLASIKRDQEYINSPNSVSELEARYYKMMEKPGLDEKEIRELRDQKDMAIRKAAEARATSPEYFDNLKQNKEKVSARLQEKYKELAEDMIESDKIRGTRVLQQYNDHIAATAKEKRGEFKTFTDYFKQNPGDLGPYITAIATSSIPDMAAIIGTAATVGVATGSPVAAGAAAGAVGYQMEYTGTLLSEMEIRAAEQGKKLSDPGVIESYIDDNAFMVAVEGKAMVRAGIIGAMDAVTGGASELIAKSINGAVKRMGTAMAVDITAGAGGEVLAQYATEDKLNWTDILNEGFGELAGAPMTVARGIYEDAKKKPETVSEAKEQAKVSVDNARVDADYKNGIYERLQALRAKTSKPTPLPAPEGFTTPLDPSKDVSGTSMKIDSQLTEESKPVEEKAVVEPAPTIVKRAATEASSKVLDSFPSSDGLSTITLHDDGNVVYTPKDRSVTPEEFNRNLDVVTAESGPTVLYQGKRRPFSVSVLAADNENPENGYTVRKIKIDLGDGNYTTVPFPQDQQTPFSTPEEARQAALKFVEASQGNRELDAFDRRDEGKKYEINGVQKGFDENDQYVPMYQMVTIRDPDHYFDGSTIMVKMKDGVVTPQDIEKAIEEKKGQEATDKARLAAMDADGSIKYDNRQPEADDEITSPQLTEKVSSFLFKAFDFYNSLTGKKPTTSNPVVESADKTLRNSFNRGIFSLLSETGSYNRVMKAMIDSNYDESSRGRMMGVLGLNEDDSKARVLTNVLGNYWSVSGNNYSQPYVYNGVALSEALDTLYREEANVDSIYDMDESSLEGISKKDLLINMAPDDIMTDSEGQSYPVQSQAYTYMSVDESVKRFNAQFSAKVIRAPKWDDSVNNKIVEASKMNRPGMYLMKLSDVTGTPQQQADHVIRSFDRGFVMKDARGDNGRNIYYSTALNSVQLTELITKAIKEGRGQDVYFETMVFKRTGNSDFNEHRVHIYVDNKGKAHAFRNLTFHKRDTLYNAQREGNAMNPDYDNLIIVPSDANDPKVIGLQRYAERIMSDKGFKDMIFGLDIGETAVLSSDGKTILNGNTIFEANALSYGMSGWLGNPLSMSEIISEMTGKPSVMAGMYEIAKTGLSKEELSDIANRIDQGMPAEFASHPDYYDSINKGVALFNRYLPSSKWLEAMGNIFSFPIKYLKKLYNVISGVFKGSVDRRFEAQQKIQKASRSQDRRASQSTENLKKYDTILVPDAKSTISLSQYIDRVLSHPNLTTPQRSVLNYIKKSGGRRNLNEIQVGQTSNNYSYYNTKKRKVGIKKSGINTRIATHEIVHAVTSDLIDVNHKKVHLMITQDYFDYDDNAAMNQIYQFVNDPRNEKELLGRGVDKDYINLARTYYSFISSLGQGGADSKLGAGAASYAFQESNPGTIPYGAVNMDEFVTEALTKPSFQKQLAKLPATYGNSRSLLSSIMQIISRIVGIPFKHGGTLLHQAVYESLAIIKDGPISNDVYSQMVDGTWIMRPSSPESDVTMVNGKPFLAEEVPQASSIKGEALTEAQAKSVELDAEIESLEARISQLRNQSEELSLENQARLKAVEPIPANLPIMREIFIDDLNDKVEAEKPQKKHTMTARRLELINKLQGNKYYAVESLGEWINDSRITDAQADILLDSMDYVFETTEDPDNLSTNKIKYYTNVLQSMSDGGPPIGFKHIAPKMFIERQTKILNYIRDNPKKGKKGRVHLQAPMADWRREIVFGMFRGSLGSTASFPTEISYMGLSEEGHQFLRDMMGYYKDNIDLQSLEETAVKQDFYQAVKAAFPKGMSQLNSKRIGVVARLTQYETTKKNPVDQILSRLNQVISGIEVEKAYKKGDGELSNVALRQILGATDLATLPDERAIISFLESKLSPAEKTVLEKIRSIGRTYMPVLQTVKAITKNTALQQFENYVHDSNVTPNEENTEQSMLKAFTSMSDILHDRKGINVSENTTYAELDITAIADKQIKSATYEKHTGMQRYMLANALAAGSQLTDLLDADTDQIKKPITNRLRTLLASYHNAMTRSQFSFDGITGLIDAGINLYVGTKILGVNAFVKNAVSSSIARFSLRALDDQALRDSMTYDTHRNEINDYLKKYLPSQYNRTNEYDIIEGAKDRYSVKSKVKRNIDIGYSPIASIIKTFPSMPREAIQKVNDTIMSSLSNVSNGYPERYSAHAIWTAAYVHYMKKNGTVVDMADFLARKPLDRRAANDASDFVSNALGYTQDKASKGTYWNSSSAKKKIISKAFSVFRQQSTGLSLDFQNNMQKASRLFLSGNFAEANNALKLATTSAANSISFRGLTLLLSGSMMWGGLDRFFNASDEEEKKKKILEAKRKYTENANRNNFRDFLSESLLMIAPITTSASFVEMATAGALDASKVVIGFTPKGIEVERKADLKKESEAIREEIAALNKTIASKEDLGLGTAAENDALEKLEQIKSQLTEKMKFKYFPSQSYKAYLSAFGSYGIAEEFVIKTIDDMIDDDLDDEELKARVKESLKNEFAFRDPLAGVGYGIDQVNDFLGYARKLIPTEHLPKNKEEGVPNSLFWMEYLKVAQNPKVVIERARAAIAEEAVREIIKREKKAMRLEQRWADKYRK